MYINLEYCRNRGIGWWASFKLYYKYILYYIYNNNEIHVATLMNNDVTENINLYSSVKYRNF